MREMWDSFSFSDKKLQYLTTMTLIKNYKRLSINW